MRVHVVTAANKASYTDELDQMFRLRHRVFVEYLGWSDLTKADGREIDGFDDIHCVYLIACKDREVHGSVRLLPTWRRSMIGEIWPEFVMDGVTFRSPSTWEWTRWCPGLLSKPKSMIAARRALIVAALEFAESRGVETYVTFCETKFYSQMQELGWSPRPLGLPRPVGNTIAIGVQWDVGPALLEETRKLMNVRGAACIEAPATTGSAFVQPWMLQTLLDIRGDDDCEALEQALRRAGPRARPQRALQHTAEGVA